MGRPRRRGQAGPLDAGPLGADLASFRLHLAAEGKAARTVQGYTSAVRWFAASYLLGQAGKTSWEQADTHDIQQWMVHLLDRYSNAYASIQFRALRQFFKWHHFSHTWLDRGGAERDLMELNGWTSPQMLTRYGASARSARARRSYDRIMNDTT